MFTTRRLRLATGLVLFTYVTLHLLNLALGLLGLEVMASVGDFAGEVWGTPVGLALLYGSLAIHLGLAFQSLYRRRSLRMPVAEAVQLVLGLSLPSLLALHVMSMRGGAELLGIDSNYRVLQTLFWNGDTMGAVQQVAALLAAWLHGCLGVYFWLRLKPRFGTWRAPLAALATAVPVLALSGFIASGREVMFRIAADPDWARRALEPLSAAPVEARAGLATTAQEVTIAFAVAVALTLALRALSLWQQARGRRFRLRYTGGRTVSVPIGMTILEASRENRVPHASVCGGRGRCSTCRVQVVSGGEELDQPGEDEARVLRRIGAPEGVRLACQTRPKGELTVTLLLPASTGPRNARRDVGFREGEERVLAILFADLRGFTALSAARLPYDVVFLLNRFAKEMGEAVEGHGGRIDKFMGDGVMALFGLATKPAEAARAALAAARDMERRLAGMNEMLAADLPAPLRMGIGLHAGRVIVGEIGHGSALGVTAVGDVVNTASRLEAATKELGATMVVSEDLLELAGESIAAARAHEIALRGRAMKIRVQAAGVLTEAGG